MVHKCVYGATTSLELLQQALRNVHVEYLIISQLDGPVHYFMVIVPYGTKIPITHQQVFTRTLYLQKIQAIGVLHEQGVFRINFRSMKDVEYQHSLFDRVLETTGDWSMIEYCVKNDTLPNLE